MSESALARIRCLLEAAFPAARIELTDESAAHAGHAGAGPAELTHLAVRIEYEAFDGMASVDRHRAVHEALEDEFERGLHALTIRAFAPGERRKM